MTASNMEPPREPVYKQWWFIVIIAAVVVIIAVIITANIAGGGGDQGDNEASSGRSDSTTARRTTTAATTSAEPSASLDDIYACGEFSETAKVSVELLRQLQTDGTLDASSSNVLRIALGVTAESAQELLAFPISVST